MTTDTREQPGILETDAIPIRTMRAKDLERVVAIDAAAIGRRRPGYFEGLIERALQGSALQISLVAEIDGVVVGFLISTLYSGEFGVMEPSAAIDGVGVHPANRGHHVARALMRQLRLNLGALHIRILRTEVEWDDADLLGFFKSEGFAPAGRLCLERTLDPTAPEG